jgi:cytochrome P450
MRETLPAAREIRQPIYSEISGAKMPYFDAVVERILKCSGTASNQARTSLVETYWLEARIPKGTNVLFMTNGLTFVAPPVRGHS